MRLFFPQPGPQTAEVARWVAARIPGPLTRKEMPFGDCVAIGVLDSGGNPAAAIVYHDYVAEHGTMSLSMAADNPRWATKATVLGMLRYPFEQVGIYRLWTLTAESNERALRFNQGVGFVREATLAHHFGKRRHAVICRMLRPDYRALVKRWSRPETAPDARAAA